MEYNNLYKEKSKEQQGDKKERQKRNCVYACNDGGNHRNGLQSMRGRGVRNDCDTGYGNGGAEWTGCEMRQDHQSIKDTLKGRANDRSGYQQAG